MFIKQGVIFENLDEVYDHYNGEVIKIVNIKQFRFYANICGLQPDWTASSPLDGRIVWYFGRSRTTSAWERWRRYEAQRLEEQKKDTTSEYR